jgi:sigma-B regulation protein RsbU (phosphoserine phosphatase)
MTFANAGHIAPYVNGFELRTEPNLPLGLVTDCVFDEVRYTLQTGDHVTVLTDGVPEAMHHRELFGFERTGLLSRQPAGEIAEAARLFGQTDDITVLTIDIVAIPASHTEQLQPTLQPA